MIDVKFGVGCMVDDPGGFAALVEELGYDSVWTGEHIVWPHATHTVIPVLGAFAARTSRIKVGSSVLLLPLRILAVVAKELAVLDVISNGRVVVGVGIGGENPVEYAVCNVPITERGARANEMLQILPRLWRESEVTFHGKFVTLDNVNILPKPVQPNGPPLVISGRSEAAHRRAAYYGDGYLPYMSTPEQCSESINRIRIFAQNKGRDLTHFGNYLLVFVSVHESRAEARRQAAEWLSTFYRQDFTKLVERYCLFGTPDDCEARLREYVDAGTRHFILSPCPAILDLENSRRWLTMVRDQVISPLRRSLPMR